MSLGRRHLLQAAAGSGLSLLVYACKKKLPESCSDTSGLEKPDVDARVALGYRDAAPFPDKTCEACQQYVAAEADGACGTCKIMKGSTHPHGYCKSFAPKG